MPFEIALLAAPDVSNLTHFQYVLWTSFQVSFFATDLVIFLRQSRAIFRTIFRKNTWLRAIPTNGGRGVMGLKGNMGIRLSGIGGWGEEEEEEDEEEEEEEEDEDEEDEEEDGKEGEREEEKSDNPNLKGEE